MPARTVRRRRLLRCISRSVLGSRRLSFQHGNVLHHPAHRGVRSDRGHGRFDPQEAVRRAAVTLPELSDTTDLRVGPEINPALLGLLPLVGNWAGHGTVKIPATAESKQYAQRVTFSHDGRPFLTYASHTWLLNPDGTVLRPAFRENGFWRVGPGEDDLELVLATAAGIVEVFKGGAGHLRWEVLT